jgi:hypothetical protein
MRSLFALLILAGLVLSLGCGKDDKTIKPDNVPPPPKDNPKGAGSPDTPKTPGK